MFSILLATYNGEKFIKQQIDSILNQDNDDFELLIQDDCSTDNTVEILKEYSNKDLRIKVYFNKENIGYTKNFLSLLKKAKGEYIVFSDQDDVWVNTRLSYTLNFFTNHNDVGLFISNDVSFGEDEIPAINHNSAESFYYPNFIDILWSCSYKGCDMCLKKVIADKIIYATTTLEFVIAHDWFILCYSYLYSKIVIDDKILLFHRIHSDNTSRKEIEGMDILQARINEINKQLKHIYWLRNNFYCYLSFDDKKQLDRYLRMMIRRKSILSLDHNYIEYIPLLIKWHKSRKVSKRLLGDIFYTFKSNVNRLNKSGVVLHK